MSGHARRRGFMLGACIGCAVWGLAAAAGVQGEPRGGAPAPTPFSATTADIAAGPTTLSIEPVAHDAAIRDRLKSVLEATGWFEEPHVRVEDGVVFLSGPAKSAELKKWAGDLARNTQGVAAVANQMEVTPASAWDFSAARSGLSGLGQEIAGALPLVMFGLLILALAGVAAWLSARGVRVLLRERVRAGPSLRRVGRDRESAWTAH